MTGPRRPAAKRRLSKERALLDAVRGNGANLGKHVLMSIVDAITSPQIGLVVVENVPSEADPRLEFFFGTMLGSVRREKRVVQEKAVGRLARRNDDIRENLRFPT